MKIRTICRQRRVSVQESAILTHDTNTPSAKVSQSYQYLRLSTSSVQQIPTWFLKESGLTCKKRNHLKPLEMPQTFIPPTFWGSDISGFPTMAIRIAADGRPRRPLRLEGSHFLEAAKSVIGLCRLEDIVCFRLCFCITSLLSLLTNLFSNLNTSVWSFTSSCLFLKHCDPPHLPGQLAARPTWSHCDRNISAWHLGQTQEPCNHGHDKPALDAREA